MKQHRNLPIPFLVVIFAAVLSILTSLANGGSRTANRVENSLQMQSIEQERMAAIYFRVMSWLSSVKTQPDNSAEACASPAPAPSASCARPVRSTTAIRLCSYHTGQRIVSTVRTRQTQN